MYLAGGWGDYLSRGCRKDVRNHPFGQCHSMHSSCLGRCFAEAPGTDEEQVTGLILQQRQVHRLVHIILVLFNDIHKVGHTVRYSFNFFHIHHNCRDKCNNTTKIGKVPGNRGSGYAGFFRSYKEYGVRSFPWLSVTL